MSDESGRISRRAAISATAGAVGAALLARAGLVAQDTPASPATAPADPTKLPGMPTSALGGRSPFVHPERAPTGVLSGPSFTPLQELTGTITPSDLHFERHHGGAAIIDPQQWKLVIHGMVERPLTFDLEDLQRFPSVTRVHFIECAGNGRNAYRAPAPGMTPQQVDGLTSNTEWTGVPLSLLFREAGLKAKATWFLAEGGDAAVLSRSIPIAKGLDDALLVWGQNGEPLRVQNGYPVRLLLPGWEGNACVKWLRRLELIDQPNMSRDETSKYTDPLPGGKARQFSFEVDAKSIITSPAAPLKLDKAGWWPVRGLAWSGRGRITRVEVSTDGGKRWADAELQGASMPKAHMRFQHMWNWTGRDALLLSRATDETGYVQPTRATFQAARGIGTDFHFNYIRGWRVDGNGAVTFEGRA